MTLWLRPALWEFHGFIVAEKQGTLLFPEVGELGQMITNTSYSFSLSHSPLTLSAAFSTWTQHTGILTAGRAPNDIRPPAWPPAQPKAT